MIKVDHRLDDNTRELVNQVRGEIDHSIRMLARFKLRPLTRAGLSEGKTYRIQKSMGGWLLLKVIEFTNFGENPRVFGQALNRTRERKGEPLGVPKRFDPTKWHAIEEVQIGD